MANPFEENVDKGSRPNDEDSNQAQTDLSYGEIATKLLKENLLLTALELHTELVESGREVPKLKEFFSNPGHFEHQASLRQEILPPMPRSSSQATLDSLDLTRYSEDGERGVDERVAVLEFELRKAKDTISALRANLTEATESETTTPDAGSIKLPHNESIKPHEQRALNFLINEYLLLHGYKLTSITFSDENENQDFEDWDDVGLNIPKPAELLNLYREFTRNSYSSKLSCQHVSCQTDEFYVRGLDFQLDTSLLNFQNVIIEDQFRKEIDSLKLERQELQQRLWAGESGLSPKLENSSTQSTTSDRFELIEGEAKDEDDTENVEDIENCRVEDDESANSQTDTEAGWTRVASPSMSDAAVNSSSTTVGSSTDSFQELMNPSVLLNSPLPGTAITTFQKEVLSCCYVNTSRQQDRHHLDEILTDGISNERLVYILSQSLPRIIPNVILNKREECIPLLVCTIHLHPEPSEKDRLVHLLFNLKKRPQEEERRIIIAGIVNITRCSGLSLMENHILPQCWEQINHRYVEKRLLVAEACSALVPHVSSSIRNSFMLSMLQQMLLEDKDDTVREMVIKSLALIVAFLDDKDKYFQCEELAMTALEDASSIVVGSACHILFPVLAKWALNLDRFQTPLLTRLLQKLKMQVKTNQVESPGSLSHQKNVDNDQKIAWTLTVIETLLPYLMMSVASVETVLSNISSDTPIVDIGEVFGSNNGLSNPSVFYTGEFSPGLILGSLESCMKLDWPHIDHNLWVKLEWFLDKLISDLLGILKEIEVSQELVVTSFIKLIQHLCDGFGKTISKEMVKPAFLESLLYLEISLANGRGSSWPPLALIPVYFLGILVSRWEQDVSDELGLLLKKFLYALPLCGAPLDALDITIRALCENTAHQAVVITTLWEGVVHPRAIVRSASATLFTSTVGIVSNMLIITRVAPALVTLASDPDISVRTATIPAFGSLITNTTIKEVQDKTYMQLQSFLSDPMARDNHSMLVKLVVTLGNIVSSSEAWFREEVILPQLAAMSAYTLQMSNQTRRSDLAVALVEAFSATVYCSLSKQTISTALLPGLRYLEPINVHQETVAAMIKGVESRIEIHRPLERSSSISLAMATVNVGQGVEDMKQRVSKIFQNKPVMNRPTNLPSLPGLFRKK